MKTFDNIIRPFKKICLTKNGNLYYTFQKNPRNDYIFIYSEYENYITKIYNIKRILNRNFQKCLIYDYKELLLRKTSND